MDNSNFLTVIEVMAKEIEVQRYQIEMLQTEKQDISEKYEMLVKAVAKNITVEED